MCRTCTVRYTLLASLSAIGATIGEIFATLQGQLSYRGWVPYDIYSSLVLFWFTSLQEMLALIFGTIVNIATETLILGFCLQICSQIEILKYRIQTAIQSEGMEKSYEKCSLRNISKKSRFSKHIFVIICNNQVSQPDETVVFI